MKNVKKFLSPAILLAIVILGGLLFYSNSLKNETANVSGGSCPKVDGCSERKYVIGTGDTRAKAEQSAKDACSNEITNVAANCAADLAQEQTSCSTSMQGGHLCYYNLADATNGCQVSECGHVTLSGGQPTVTCYLPGSNIPSPCTTGIDRNPPHTSNIWICSAYLTYTRSATCNPVNVGTPPPPRSGN